MKLKIVIFILRQHELELRALGVQRLCVYGSVARGEETEGSDIDLVAQMTSRNGLEPNEQYICARLEAILQSKVDLVHEPINDAAFRAEVKRDRVPVF